MANRLDTVVVLREWYGGTFEVKSVIDEHRWVLSFATAPREKLDLLRQWAQEDTILDLRMDHEGSLEFTRIDDKESV